MIKMEKNENIDVPYLNQIFHNLDAADRFIMTYALKNELVLKI